MDWFYEAEDALEKLNNDSLPDELTPEHANAYGNFLLRQKRFKEAIPFLQITIKNEKRNKQKAREYYLLGQIYKETGDYGNAYRAYGKTIKLNPPYELELSARIKQTEVIPAGKTEKTIKTLRKMARNGKNAEYQDQIYYAIGNIYLPSQFMGYDNITNGDFSITYDRQPKDQYDAGSTIYAGFVDTEYYPVEDFLVNVGIRYERNKQWVNYYTDGAQARRNELNQNDFFPAMNLKYTVNKSNSLRLSVSRTVTRPSFIEMAPFLYQESYGAAQIRGNENLKNGYNYNIDLRYERFDAKNPDNMFSITGYAKILQDPIERTQTLSGGAAVHSFQNADTGTAAGVEIEFRRELLKDLRLGVNGSYMYTSVKLPEGGAYTNNQRSLQGASPYLVNADLSYAPTLRNGDQLTATLLYNLQGPRIHAVGISGLGDEKQEALHTLDLVLTYKLNDHFSLKLEATDLINQDVVFNQKTNDGRTLEVERYERGTGIQVGFSYNL